MAFFYTKIILFTILLLVGNISVYGFSVEYNEAPPVEQKNKRVIKKSKKKFKKKKQANSKKKNILLITSLIYSVGALAIILIFIALGLSFSWVTWLIISVLLVAALVSLIWALLIDEKKGAK